MGENFNEDRNLIDVSDRKLKVGNVYRHYKRQKYLVLYMLSILKL